MKKLLRNYMDPTDYYLIDEEDVYTGKFYNEDINTYKKKLYLLKQWCVNDPRIPSNISKPQLFQFLYPAHYNVPKAFQLLIEHYALMKLLPEIFSGRNPVLNKEIIEAWGFIKLASFPIMTSESSRIFYVGLYPNKEHYFSIKILVKLFIMGIEASLLCEGIAKTYSVIVDTRNFPTDISLVCYKPLLLKYLVYFLDGLQIIVNDVHVLFYPGSSEKLVKLRNYLLNEINKKVYFHIFGCPETLEFFNYFPKECLPKDLNGFLQEDIMNLALKMKSMIESSRKYFRHEELQRLNLPSVNVDEMKKQKEKIRRNVSTEENQGEMKNIKKLFRKRLRNYEKLLYIKDVACN